MSQTGRREQANENTALTRKNAENQRFFLHILVIDIQKVKITD